MSSLIESDFIFTTCLLIYMSALRQLLEVRALPKPTGTICNIRKYAIFYRVLVFLFNNTKSQFLPVFSNFSVNTCQPLNPGYADNP